ncbi:MAG: hypothetical protein IJV50_09075 [Lachnospiraceae bacterium]|nr:hypothetical protein [Lachnospiraceae bacterium]
MISAKSKKRIVTAVLCVIAVVLVIAIFGHWNEMWYHFGENIYRLTHR